MSRALAAGAVAVLAVVGSATAAWTQGLVSMQKLSAPLANELVGDAVGKAVADRMGKNPPSTVPQTPLPNVTYAVGGVTIMADGRAIGAIGVSGAPGGQFDEECARAAIAKIQAKMK